MSPERVTVYVVDEVAAAELELHVRPGTGARCALYGWDVVPEPVDAGPPTQVVDVFAHALAKVATVAFLDAPVPEVRDDGWQLVGGDQWRRLAPTLGQRLLGHRPLALVATRCAERLRALFGGEVSWSQRLQAALVLGDGPLPPITRDQVVAVVEARDADLAALPLPVGVTALVLPAVDGDYLELVGRDPAVVAAIRAAVATECAQRGLGFEARTDWR